MVVDLKPLSGTPFVIVEVKVLLMMLTTLALVGLVVVVFVLDDDDGQWVTMVMKDFLFLDHVFSLRSEFVSMEFLREWIKGSFGLADFYLYL